MEFGLGLSRGFQRRTIWIADADRGDGKGFVVHANEKLTPFLELGSVLGGPGWCIRRGPTRKLGGA
jgi:hypothetical protein